MVVCAMQHIAANWLRQKRTSTGSRSGLQDKAPFVLREGTVSARYLGFEKSRAPLAASQFGRQISRSIRDYDPRSKGRQTQIRSTSGFDYVSFISRYRSNKFGHTYRSSDPIPYERNCDALGFFGRPRG